MSDKNRDQPGFPTVAKYGGTRDYGLTKRELGALLIAGHIYDDDDNAPDGTFVGHKEAYINGVALTAIRLADAILNKTETVGVAEEHQRRKREHEQRRKVEEYRQRQEQEDQP